MLPCVKDMCVVCWGRDRLSVRERECQVIHLGSALCTLIEANSNWNSQTGNCSREHDIQRCLGPVSDAKLWR